MSRGRYKDYCNHASHERASLTTHTRVSLQTLVAALSLFSFSTSISSAQITESGNLSDSPVQIRVTSPQRPEPIPATVFGSFLEPIGHSTYGGLWSDVVENPSFEEGLWSAGNVTNMLRTRPELQRSSQLGVPLPWEPLDFMQGARFLPIRGDAANSSQSLLIMAPPDKETGVRQTVYLPVHRELEYNGSIWIKHLRGHNDVKVSLRQHDRTDHILVSATLDAPAREWSKYTFHLKLQSGELARLEPADLTISVSDDTRIQIDEVSLVPADNIDGMDPDMIAMARELHSSLIRFGGNFTSAYDWHDG